MTTSSLPSTLTRAYDLVCVLEILCTEDTAANQLINYYAKQLRIDIGMQIVDYLHQYDWKFEENDL